MLPTTSFEIGTTVWLVSGTEKGHLGLSRPFEEWNIGMAEPWDVAKITANSVFVRSFIDPDNPPWKTYRLNRGHLQRFGWTINRQIRFKGMVIGAPFVAALPESYRRQTLGYFTRDRYAEVLGLTATEAEDEGRLKAAFRAKARETYPQHGKGDAAAFQAVKEAYDKLSKGLTLADYLQAIKDVANGKA